MDAKTVSYILNELGEDREDYFNAIAPPIIQTSNFAFKTVMIFAMLWRMNPRDIYTAAD